MNALLKPIETRCVEIPVYDNTSLVWRSAWIHDNYEKLWSYWRSLDGADTDEDWDGFTWVQWDREMTKRENNRSTLRQYE